MANPWFKFYASDYLSDQKMLALNAAERSCWVTLLCYANQNNGTIKYLDEITLVTQSGVTLSDSKTVIGVLEKFQKLNMIHIDNGTIEVLNWKKRQEVYSDSYLRVKRWREKKRDVTLPITLQKRNHDNVRREEKRRDKNRIEEREEMTPSQIASDFFAGNTEELLNVFSEGKDKNFVQNEFKKFILYWTEPNKSGTKVRWQLETTFDVKRRLFTWLNRSNQYGGFNKGKKILV